MSVSWTLTFEFTKTVLRALEVREDLPMATLEALEMVTLITKVIQRPLTPYIIETTTCLTGIESRWGIMTKITDGET